MRKCSKCGGSGPFNKNKYSKDGLYSICKTCEREARKEYNSRPDVKKRMKLNQRRRDQTDEGRARKKRAKKRYRSIEANKITELEYSRAYTNKEESMKKKRAYEKKYRSKDAFKNRMKEFRRKNKNRTRARNAISYGVNNGTITRPDSCSTPSDLCDGPIQAHHEDYDKPLDVIWLCRFHHLELHRIKDGKNWHRRPISHLPSCSHTGTSPLLGDIHSSTNNTRGSNASSTD